MPTEDSPEASTQFRVLLLPPTARDAEAIGKVLLTIKIECETCTSMDDLCQKLAAGAGAIVASEEALLSDPACLQAIIASQPLWSDLPIIVLSRSGSETPAFTSILSTLGNVSVLERPIRISTLLSVVRSALRGRKRQYEARDHLVERESLLLSEQHARGQAERAGRLKDEFLATLSHELRTPLNAILGWSQILALGPASAEDISEGIQIVQRNAKAQAQIIADLLDMSAIISGKIRLALQDVDLAEVLKSAIETVQPAADAKNVGIMASFDPDVGRVSGDPNRLQQVFWNLLSNAVKFTSRGGSINVQLERVASHLEVRVQDSGEGIKPEFLAFVFDRFRQEDATTTRRVGGLGLGLAIVKQLVELHGGSVHAASDGPSLGSTFTIKFPMRPIRQTHESLSDSEARAKVSLPTMSTQAIAGLRILVVDDELDARVLVRRLLNERGAEALLTGSVAEAIQVLSSTSVDVLISDIGMPSEDGYSLIRRVRQLPGEGSRIPAIALTAYARAEDREKILRSGFQEHLAKPVDAGELLSVIERLGGKPSVG